MDEKNLGGGCLLSQQKEDRNYGVDLLKIVSMFMVVVLHVFGQGGILSKLGNGTLNWYIGWGMELLSYGAVNCFAMATGYLMINKKYKTSRIITLWLEVVFYSVLLTLVMKFIYPDEVGGHMILKSVLPVISKSYWYFTAYFALFFLIPLINTFMNKQSKRVNTLLLATALVLYSVLATCSRFFLWDVFAINDGYSPWWLAVMYIVGAYIKKYDFMKNLKKRWCFLIYISAVAVTLVSMILLPKITKLVDYQILVSYISPTVVIGSIALVLLCVKKQVKNGVGKKVLTFLSSLTFGVYIVHMHPLIYEKMIAGRFAYLATQPFYVLIGMVLVWALAIYAFSMVVSLIRSLLFKYCKINKLGSKLGDAIDKKLLAEKPEVEPAVAQTATVEEAAVAIEPSEQEISSEEKTE